MAIVQSKRVNYPVGTRVRVLFSNEFRRIVGRSGYVIGNNPNNILTVAIPEYGIYPLPHYCLTTNKLIKGVGERAELSRMLRMMANPKWLMFPAKGKL